LSTSSALLSVKIEASGDTHVLRSGARIVFRWLIAITLAITMWYGVHWLTTVRPDHFIVPGVLVQVPNFNGWQTRYYRFDSTGWWLAVGPPEYGTASPPDTWQVYHLKTGEVRTLTWKEYCQHHTWVPLVGGYRHTRPTRDGGVEVVDTRFADGTSTVLKRFERGQLEDNYLKFSRDGSRMVTIHRMPSLSLLTLGASPGLPLADVMAWVSNGNRMFQINTDHYFLDIPANPVLVRIWNLPSGEIERQELFPAFSSLGNLAFSPNGKWLVKFEQVSTWGVAGKTTVPKVLPWAGYQPVQPRGITVLECDTGKTRTIMPPLENADERYWRGHVGNAGIHLYESHTGRGHLLQEKNCVITLPELSSASCGSIFGNETINPDRTTDGLDIGLIHRRTGYFVGRIEVKEQTFSPIEPLVPVPSHSSCHLLPLATPGQVLVTYQLERVSQSLINWCRYLVNYDISRLLPNQSVASACIVDAHQNKVVWNGSIAIPNTSQTQRSVHGITATADRKALQFEYFEGSTLHIYRWSLPLVSWSPLWSIVAGMATFVLMMRFTRKPPAKVA
jgi:hypothetical protein